MSHTLSRRSTLALLGASAFAASSAGCDMLSTNPESDGSGGNETTADSEGTPADSMEAPMLADLVKSGKLPALEDRIPESPLVVETVEGPGTYGGTWHSVMLGPSAWYTARVLSDHLMRWTPDGTKVIPNIAESAEVVGDGREYTIHLRPGMRWSDGEPFTSADIVYVINDMLMNEEINPVPPTWIAPGGKPPEVTATDEQTVSIVFQEPYGFFLQYEAAPRGVALTAHPKHYLKQFNKVYNKDVTAQAKQEGFDNWVDFYSAKSDSAGNPELPTLGAWQSTTTLGKGKRMVLKRNPYYWKVDGDGRQLPYIDEVVYNIVNDDQVIVLQASRGDLDMQIRYINTLQNKPVLARNREKGGYRFFDVNRDQMNTLNIALNLAHQDPVKREVYSNKDFRIGLSYAIDRKEIIKAAYQGQGEPWQVAPKRGTAFYDEEMAKQYTEFDATKANEHLDRAGFTQRSGSGIRLGPDGKPISIAIEYSSGLFPEWTDALELVKRYWREVGVDTRLKNVDRSLLNEHLAAGKHDAGVWQGDGGSKWTVLLRPYWYIPFNSTYSIFAPVWAQWYVSGGADGEKPPAWSRRQLELYDQVKATADVDQQVDLMKQVLQIHKEQFPAMGIHLPAPSFGIVKNNFHNVPEQMIGGYLFGTPAQSNPQQYYIDNG